MEMRLVMNFGKEYVKSIVVEMMVMLRLKDLPMITVQLTFLKYVVSIFLWYIYFLFRPMMLDLSLVLC